MARFAPGTADAVRVAGRTGSSGHGCSPPTDTAGLTAVSSDVPLEVHHVDGEPTDNRIANTIPLCRDCHHKATFPGI